MRRLLFEAVQQEAYGWIFQNASSGRVQTAQVELDARDSTFDGGWLQFSGLETVDYKSTLTGRVAMEKNSAKSGKVRFLTRKRHSR